MKHIKKTVELSNITEEVGRLREENEKLVTRLASVEETQEVIENVQETLKEEKEDNEGESTALGEVLEKVVALDDAFSELSSKFENVLSNIKTVTPLEAGIGKMSTSSEEGEEVIEDPAEEVVEELATPDEIVAAIEVLETYVDEVGDLQEVLEDADPEAENPLEESSKKAKDAVKVLLASIQKNKTAKAKALQKENASKSKKIDLNSLREQIKSKKPVETSSTKTVDALRDKIQARKFERESKIETSSIQGSEYSAGSLAGGLFDRLR